jgi:hypothetical protein
MPVNRVETEVLEFCMLRLSGYDMGYALGLPGATKVSAESVEKKLQDMKEARQTLLLLTEKDFGYDLEHWYEYLLNHNRHRIRRTGWFGVRALEEALKDESRIRLVMELGNPFCPVTVEPACRTRTVVAIARTIYEERTFESLPILADALEEAGCTNTDILAHCRQPGEHVRGCWVDDLLLGKK